ncbi:hypothetical protein DFR29_1231 [Tahibacter aquaticus]|uniref:Uncharacterized protein n=1 Tax=Tahibacter aquaticus TaxID=520092 RepID=A0A4R6YL51_9GAMM|nr:hypothetical protein DFR29_1231 [Tahibacter aquaticus]
MEASATRSRSTKATKPASKKAATPPAENSRQSTGRRAMQRRIDNDYLDGKPVSAAARGATVATKVDRVALLGLNHVVDPDAGIEDLMTEVICHLQAAHQIGELVSAELYDVGSQMAANPRDASVSVRHNHLLHSPTSRDSQRQRCGSSSAMRRSGCVGRRVNTSLRYA